MKKQPFVVITLLFAIASGGYLAYRGEPNTDGNAPPALAILPLTGPSGDLGKSVYNGMTLAFEAQPPGPGQRTLKAEDTAGDANRARSIYNQYRSADAPPAVMSWMSSAANALRPLAAEDKRLLFAGAAVPGITQPDGLVVRVWPTAPYIAELMAGVVSRDGRQKVAVLYVNDDYGKSVMEAFAKQFAANPSTIVLSEGFAATTADFRSLLAKAAELQVDAIYMPAYGNAYIKFLRQAREQFGAAFPIYADITLLSKFTLREIGPEGNGVVALATVIDLDEQTDPAAKAFVESHQKRFNAPPDFNTGLGYAMAHIYLQALSQQAVKPQDFIRGKTFDTPLGKIQYDAQNDCRVELVPAQLNDGKITRYSPK